jgi:hypothetical protein
VGGLRASEVLGRELDVDRMESGVLRQSLFIERDLAVHGV